MGAGSFFKGKPGGVMERIVFKTGQALAQLHTKGKDSGGTSIHHQAQYRIHFAPMIVKKWALSLFIKTGFQPATTLLAAHTDIEYACCQICKYPGGYKPINSEPLFLDMYICDVCQRTYRSLQKQRRPPVKTTDCWPAHIR
eukprot:243806-Pelagomonas_calceolata.AAC.1